MSNLEVTETRPNQFLVKRKDGKRATSADLAQAMGDMITKKGLKMCRRCQLIKEFGKENKSTVCDDCR